MNNDIVAFDHGPWEFPIATVRPRDPRSFAVVLLGDVRRWLVARWQWLRPRTVPVIVAAAGMLAVLASADYLSRDHSGIKNDQVILRIDHGPPPAHFR